jgi:hypothetical protein
VLELMNSVAATSEFESPSDASHAIRDSWGVSSIAVSVIRLRAPTAGRKQLDAGSLGEGFGALRPCNLYPSN